MQFHIKSIIAVMLLVVFIVSCTNNSSTGDSISENTDNSGLENTENFVSENTASPVSGNPGLSLVKVQKIEVYHFHGTNQCYSCKTVGAYAEETVNTYFSEELKSGKIIFAHINGDLAENKEKVQQYGVTGSSLWIGIYDDAGFHPEQNVNVWYKISNKEDYMNYLKGIIDKRLAGDYS
jgi:hypothetical protein